MKHIKAIGFDLFNTLITFDYSITQNAMDALFASLDRCGINIQRNTFEQAYLSEAGKLFAQARKDHIEIHNSLWISNALKACGVEVGPDDPRIYDAVNDYFSEFFPGTNMVPGTHHILGKLKKKFKLGLLSNFTHAPFVRELMARENLIRYFDTILISDELGFRKPNPIVFHKLFEHLETEKYEIMYIGDDPEADIKGAQKAGLVPVWTTIVRDQKLSREINPFSPQTDDPDNNIPRISRWEDLELLLFNTSTSIT